MGKIYMSTYCNKGHRLVDGKPVDHECVIIPPKALQAEREGDFEMATVIIVEASPLKSHRGVKP
jgi:hypothetical protein